jgi:hypothetical protein
VPKKRKPGNVVLGPEPHFATCTRCGEHIEKPKMPLSIPAFVAYCNYAEELHARCEVKAE